MIALSVARIAEIVGGELADITPAEAAATHVTGSFGFAMAGKAIELLLKPRPAA